MENYYSYGTLDPRKSEVAKIANDALLGESTFGIEVSIPELANRCKLGNIDPQHTGGDPTRAAIEVVSELSTSELPPQNSTLVTIRADLDSVASMALLELRASGGLNLPAELATDVVARIKDIAIRDKCDRGGWPGVRPLPTENNQWGSNESHDIAALAASVSDFKVSMADRVNTMKDYLVAGIIPEKYREQTLKERNALIQAISSGDIKSSVYTLDELPVAVVESTHRAATGIGYLQAPVVVAVNPEFSFNGGPAHRKITICQFEAGYIDLAKVKTELASLESGWGGSNTIIGSPQGEGSEISIEQILSVIKTAKQTN